MVNELDRFLEIALCCGRAHTPIFISIIADTGKGKTQRLRQFTDAFEDCVYYVPPNTSAYRAREAIRMMHGVLDLVVIDDCSWIPDYDKHTWVSLIREICDGRISKDTRDTTTQMATAQVHCSVILSNNERTLRSRFITEMENQGVTDRLIPFRYCHSQETEKYIRRAYARARNRTPPTLPTLWFNKELPKQIAPIELDDAQIERIIDKYQRARYANQVVSMMRVACEIEYEQYLPYILEFVGNSMVNMNVLFEDPGKAVVAVPAVKS